MWGKDTAMAYIQESMNQHFSKKRYLERVILIQEQWPRILKSNNKHDLEKKLIRNLLMANNETKFEDFVSEILNKIRR